MKLNLSSNQSARKMLEQVLKPIPGVSSEAIRKNKILECLKSMFTQQDAFSIPRGIDAASSDEMAKVCAQIKRQISHKKVNSKPLNGKMLLSLALEYSETLSAMSQNVKLPGH